MGLLDEVRANDYKHNRQSKIAEIKSKLAPEDYDEFVVAISDVTISQAALIRALQKRGIKIGTGTISNVRRDLLAGGLDLE